MAGLAVDLGGTKTLLALVENDNVLARIEQPTNRNDEPDAWVTDIARKANEWLGRYDYAGITVTGLVKDNYWWALNTNTLAVPDAFALGARLEQALGIPVTLANDAQAAAWGEYVYGAGQQRDIVYITVSTGIGGGVIVGGRLVRGRGGVAGHFGQLAPLFDDDTAKFEDHASGRWVGQEGQKYEIGDDARAVFEAAAKGHERAELILKASTRRVARLGYNLQLLLDPELIVIGGGLGLASGYIERLEAQVAHLETFLRPKFIKAKLGKDAGVIGIADLSRIQQFNERKDND